MIGRTRIGFLYHSYFERKLTIEFKISKRGISDEFFSGELLPVSDLFAFGVFPLGFSKIGFPDAHEGDLGQSGIAPIPFGVDPGANLIFILLQLINPINGGVSAAEFQPCVVGFIDEDILFPPGEVVMMLFAVGRKEVYLRSHAPGKALCFQHESFFGNEFGLCLCSGDPDRTDEEYESCLNFTAPHNRLRYRL